MKHYLSIFLLLMFSLNVQAALNKWVDAEGNVHYSDTAPIDTKVQKIRNYTAPEPVSADNTDGKPQTLAERQADWKKTQQAKKDAEQKIQQQNEASAIKKQNCENARSNLSALENNAKLITYNSDGEKTYLDDASRAQKIEEARKAISSYCI